jgi:purine-binding chemotaxis protein CheW
MGIENEFSTFWVDDLYLGVPIGSVDEVKVKQKMATVPLSPDAVVGLINLRGHVVTAVDLRERFDLPSIDKQTQNHVVITRGSSEDQYSLLVDDIDDVVDTGGLSLKEPPDNLDRDIADFINGVYELEQSLLFTLDIEPLLDLHDNR